MKLVAITKINIELNIYKKAGILKLFSHFNLFFKFFLYNFGFNLLDHPLLYNQNINEHHSVPYLKFNNNNIYHFDRQYLLLNIVF